MFSCNQCSYQTSKWLGQCPDCGTWNSFEEVTTVPPKSSGHTGAHTRNVRTSPVNTLSEIVPKKNNRIATGSAELDRVLGGGLLAQSIVLISGEPGIGKSTLLLQTAAGISANHHNNTATHTTSVLYICAEESPEQVALRAKRLGLQNHAILLTAEHRIERIEQQIQTHKPEIVILDSIQTLRSETLGITSGHISHIRACITLCSEWCEQYNCTILVVAHITKDGAIAGPKLIEHMVDTVLMFEQSKYNLRFLYAQKNRHGTIDEVSIFRMTENGLEDVTDTSVFFLDERKKHWPPGICVAATYEGTRPFLVELQALTVPCTSNNRVFSEHIDSRQIFRIAAVLERHVRTPLSNQNIYVNVAGGIRVQEPGFELAIALALYSAYQNSALPANTCAIGEISLAGEIRAIDHFEQRCRQAAEYGFSNIIVPSRNMDKANASLDTLDTKIMPIKTINDAVSLF